MEDFTKDFNTLYDKAGKEIRMLNNKESLSREEIKAAFDALCLMHKIKHFESDEEKYGWNEDAWPQYSQRGWVINETPQPPYAYAYGAQNGSNMSSRARTNNSRAYPMGMYGNSYNDSRYSRHGDAGEMIGALESLDESSREAAMEYINHLRGRG